MQVLSEREILADPNEQTEAVREAAAEGLADFRVFVTQIMNFNGSIPGMPDYTDPGYDPLFDAIPSIEEKDALIELPRGTGKTTLMSQLYPLWLGLRDPNETILLVHAKHAVACRWISTIKAWMLGGYREPDQPGSDLRAVYGPLGMLPPLGAKQWGKVEALDFPGRTVKFDETTIMASGMDNIVTGGHWGRIVSDDLINRENFRSPELLRQAHEWWQLTRGLGRGKKRRVVIGTRWNSQDLLGIIEDEQKALVAKGEAPTKTICILPARKEDGTPRFKHKGEAELQADFIEMGPSIYAGQMDLRPVADGLQPLKEEYFKPYYNLADIGHKGAGGRFIVNEEYHVAIFVDLAASLKEGRDRTAIIVRASDPRGHIYVLEAMAGQWLPAEAFARIVGLQKKYRAQYVGCEKGPLRAAYEGFLREWNGDHRSAMLHFADIEIGGGKGGNNDRILALEPFAVQRMIHLLPDQTELLYELCLYPNGKRDDLCDCLAQAVHNPFRPRVKKKREKELKSDCDQILDMVLSRNKPVGEGVLA